MMCAHLSFLSSTLLLSSSNEVWGTGDDPVNLKSSLEECSFNKLTVDPSLVIQNDATADMEVAPGVIEVTIDVPLDGSSSDAIRNAVTTKVQEKLGYNLPGPYDYVLYSLEKCYGDDCGWAAYAYINSWNSVYQGVYYKRPGVLVHEVSMCIAVYPQISYNIWGYTNNIFYLPLSLDLSARSQLRPRSFRRIELANIY